jgi:hypothetical protein
MAYDVADEFLKDHFSPVEGARLDSERFEVAQQAGVTVANGGGVVGQTQQQVRLRIAAALDRPHDRLTR